MKKLFMIIQTSLVALSLVISPLLATSTLAQGLDPLPAVEIPVNLPDTSTPREAPSLPAGIGSRILNGALGGALSVDSCNPQKGDFLKGALSGALSVGIGALGSKVGKALNSPLLKGALSFIPGGGAISGILGGVMGGGGGGPQQVIDAAINKKEECLDRLARIAALETLQETTDSIVFWIQEGFEVGREGAVGNPGFVTNLHERLLYKENQAYNRFMAEAGKIDAICDVFEPAVVLGLGERYTSGEFLAHVNSFPERLINPQGVNTNDEKPCRLEEIVGTAEDINAFLEGDFTKGGWEGWQALTGDVNSNPYLAYFNRVNELDRQTKERVDNELEQLRQSNGILPVERCSGSGESPGIAGKCPDGSEPIIVTPGVVVREILTDVITSEIRRAEIADEAGEVVGKFAESLLNRITRAGIIVRNPTTGEYYSREGTIYDRENVLAELEEIGNAFRDQEGKTPVDWLGNNFFWNPVVIEEQDYVKISFTGKKYAWKDGEFYIPEGQSPVCNEDTHGAIQYVATTGSFIAEGDFAISNPADRALPPGLWIKAKCDKDAEGHDFWTFDELEDAEVSDCQYAPRTDDRRACYFDAWRFPHVASEGKTYRYIDGEIQETACISKEDVGEHYFVLNEHNTWLTRECVRREAPEGQEAIWKDEQILDRLLVRVRYTVEIEALLESIRTAIVKPLIFLHATDTGRPIFNECLPQEEGGGGETGEFCNANAGEENVGEGEVSYPDGEDAGGNRIEWCIDHIRPGETRERTACHTTEQACSTAEGYMEQYGVTIVEGCYQLFPEEDSEEEGEDQTNWCIYYKDDKDLEEDCTPDQELCFNLQEYLLERTENGEPIQILEECHPQNQ